VTPELHTGIASTPTGHKAWVVGLSPYTPAIGAWDYSTTVSSRAKAEAWVATYVNQVWFACQQVGVTFKVRRWIDGAEQP
jgi:hypothetical protein